MLDLTPYNLRIPGPTPLPPHVLKAISQQMINHRGQAYEEMQARVTKSLKHFFQTESDIFLLTASGMGGLEAAIVNFFSPGDKLIFFTCGEFGNRWAEIGRRYGGNVIHVKTAAGKAVLPLDVVKVLNNTSDIRGVFFTHNETSSGVINDIAKLAYVIKCHPQKPLFLIDSISALGSVNLPMDKVGIDVLVSASQKGWMAPPGMAMIAVSSLAWEAHKRSTMPRYYFDISMYKEFAVKNQTPATVAISVMYGLDAALKLMVGEGREAIYLRHLRVKEKMREGVRKLGLKLFVKDEKDASPTITSIVIPRGVDGKTWLTRMREKYKVVLAAGMGETKGKIIRVAHMGYVSLKDIDIVLYALQKSLKDIK